MKVCDDVFRAGIDFVFVPGIYFTQENISALIYTILRFQISKCHDHIKQIICNYYLSHCGNESFQVSPYTICPEDCNAVQKNCDEEWKNAQLIAEFYDYEFISCDDTSALLLPLKSCCKRVGLQLQPSVTEGNKTIIFHILIIL